MLQEESEKAPSASPKLITVDIVHPGPFPPIIQIVRTFLTAKKGRSIQEEPRSYKSLGTRPWFGDLYSILPFPPFNWLTIQVSCTCTYVHTIRYMTSHQSLPTYPFTLLLLTLSQKSQSSYLRIKTHAQYLYLLSPRPQLIPFPVPHLPFESFHQEMKYGETLQQRSIPLWETCMSTLSIRCHHMFAVLTSQSPR